MLKLAARHFDAFLANPVLPLLMLEDPGFCARIPASTLRRLLRRTKLPGDFLQPLFRHADREIADCARLHCSGDAVFDEQTEVFSTLCASSVSRGLFGTMLRLGMVPVWMLEALAGSASLPLCVMAMKALAAHPSPEAREIDYLYQRTGILPPDEEDPWSTVSPCLSPEQLERLARGGPRARRVAALHPNTNPATLRRLAGDPARTVRLTALRNRAVPAETLWAYAGLADARVRLAVLANPCAPESIIEQLASDPLPQIRAAALRHRLANAAVLDRFAADPDVKVRLHVAKHRATGPATLAKLARDADFNVRIRVARRVHLPEEEIELLSRDGLNVRCAIARRRDLSEEQMLRLLCDEKEDVAMCARIYMPRNLRWALGNTVQSVEDTRIRLREIGWKPRPRATWTPPSPRPLRQWVPPSRRWRHRPSDEDWNVVHAASEKDLPYEDYERFVAHPEPKVRETVANNYSTPPLLLHRLANDPVLEVRKRLSFNRSLLPETFEILSRDSSAEVRRFTAYNHSVPPSVLERLANDPDQKVRESVIHNHATPEATLRELARTQGDKFWQEIRHKSNAPADMLATAFEQPGALREVIAHHPNFPRSYIDTALSNNGSATMRHAVAQNPSLTSSDLERLLDVDGSMASLVAKHRAITLGIARRIASTGDFLTLSVLAGNINTPPEILAQLAEDGPPALFHALAHNTAAPRETLTLLSERAGPTQAQWLVNHPRLSEDAVRMVAAKLPKECSEWYTLLGNPALTPAVLQEIYANADDSLKQKITYMSQGNLAGQMTLIAQGDDSVKHKLTWNKALSHEAMMALAGDKNESIRSSLAGHPRLTLAAMHVLWATAQDASMHSCLIRSALAFHQNTPPDFRLEIAQAEMKRFVEKPLPVGRSRRRIAPRSIGGRLRAYDSIGLLLGLLPRHEMPLALFEPLLNVAEKTVEQALLDRPDLPDAWRAKIRERVLRRAVNGSLTSRVCALSSPDCPPASLEKLAREGRWLDRYAVAKNPASPRTVIAFLAEDSNRVVRAAAKATMDAVWNTDVPR